MSEVLRLATRGSALALWQTNRVIELLRAKHPHLETELAIISTTPDRRPEASLQELSGDKGLFVRELEEALNSGKADAAIHSLKDVPIQDMPPHLHLAAFPERAPAHDVWLSRDGSHINDLLPGSVVGTSALRRQGQLLAARPDLITKPIRGNVDNRIQKLHRGEYDAIILAAAGLHRLGIINQITADIPPQTILCAAGQGILAVESPIESPWNGILSAIDNPVIRLCAELERAFNHVLGTDCHSAAACHASVENDMISFRARIISPDGNQVLNFYQTQPVDYGIQLAIDAANQLLEQGAKEILLNCPPG